jgi:competence protein ComEA
MFTPDELRALALVLALVTLGASLTWLDARHPRMLTLTLGDSLALGAAASAGAEEGDPPSAGAPESSAVARSKADPSRPGAPDEAPEPLQKTSFGLDGRLDLNRASADELEGLPGIGPKTAQRILEDRRMRGRFRKASDLTRVKGIGPKTLARLLPHITVLAARDSAR